MKRPILLRVLPDRLKQSLYFRYYHTRHANWAGLFERAPLALAPDVAMYQLLQGDVISGCLAFNGSYELELSREIVKLAKDRKLLVDVGANMGYFSLLWAAQNPDGRVLSFEASPRNLAILENNVSKNNLSDRITIIPKAVGDHTGTIAFDVGPAEQTGWGGIAATASENSIKVPLVCLDEELAGKSIDVLKIDVEGADTWVIFGCEQLLREKRIGMIFFEQYKGRMHKLGIAEGAVQAFLKKLDYTCMPFGDDEEEWMAYPNEPAEP